MGQIAPPELLRPVTIRFDLIDEDRALLPPVAAEIGLPVAFDVEPLDAATTLYGLLPDGGAHGSSAPLDLARQPDVDREQSGHLCSVRDGRGRAALEHLGPRVLALGAREIRAIHLTHS